MDLKELGLDGTDAMVFRAVQEKLSYREAAKATGLSEGRVKHRFFSACERIQKDPKGRQLVETLLSQLYAVERPAPSSPES